MWGDAVDLQNVIHPSGDRLSCNPQYDPQHPRSQPAQKTPCLVEYNRIVQMAGFALANYIEPPNLSCAYNCVHADWRYWPGPLQHTSGDLQ